MNDLISRKDAIEAIKKEIYLSSFDDPAKIGLKIAAKTLSDKRYVKSLPSAPERRGKWIIVTDSRGRHAECPYCGEWKYHSNQKFCGECGARIEEEER